MRGAGAEQDRRACRIDMAASRILRAPAVETTRRGNKAAAIPPTPFADRATAPDQRAWAFGPEAARQLRRRHAGLPPGAVPAGTRSSTAGSKYFHAGNQQRQRFIANLGIRKGCFA